MTLSQTFKVVLEQDVILSATTATSGQHRSLDYLSGSVFLGIVASRGYHSLDEKEAWTLFHSGAVRFNDASICVDGAPSYPLPLSLHAYKGDSFINDQSRLIAGQLFDPALSTATESIRQQRQLRGGYITQCGQYSQPLLDQRLKTAIDPATGRAANSQLFNYEALRAGQVFLFHLEAEASAEALFTRAVKWLGGPASIGRSRSAQYGQVIITPIDGETPTPRCSTVASTELTLWLLSDLALLGTNGQSTLTPKPELLGLPTGSTWLSERSYIRTRRYSPYNGKRRCHDPERQVLNRGSVLRYQLPRALDTKESEGVQSAGLYRESGLGRIAINPSLLDGRHPTFEPLTARSTSSTIITASTPSTALVSLLLRRAALAGDKTQTETLALAIFNQLLVLLQQARVWNGLPLGQPLAAPGRSQWGGIKQLASDQRDRPETLWRALLGGDKAVIRDRSGWNLATGPSTTLAAGMHEILKSHGLQDNPQLADVIGHLAVHGLSLNWANAVSGATELKEKNA